MMEPKLLPGGIVKLWGIGFFWKTCDIGEAKEQQKNRRILNYQGSQGVFWYLVGDWALIAPFSSLGVFGTIKAGSVFCPLKVEHLSRRVNGWVSGPSVTKSFRYLR